MLPSLRTHFIKSIMGRGDRGISGDWKREINERQFLKIKDDEKADCLNK